MNRSEIRKLENMIESRFVIMHSRLDSTGDAAGAARTRALWHEHICSLGMHLIRNREHDGRLYFLDPGTLMESHWGLPVVREWIVVPHDIATKILALGHIP